MSAAYTASDTSGPCFNFDKVVGAGLAIFNRSSVNANPLFFCDSVPFTLKIPLIATLGSGCDGTNPCWASSQFTGLQEREGPYLTEITGTANAGTLIVGEASGTKAVYSFERYVPSSADAYPVAANTPVILLRVFQPGGGSGYVQMRAGSLDDVTSSTLHSAAVVPKPQVVANKVMWGVIGRDKTSNCMLMYADSTVATAGALPMIQAFNWGNKLYKSRGVLTQGSRGVHSSFHGITTTPKALGIYDHAILYTDSNMTLVAGSLPEFDPQHVDGGAANVQWTITALPLTQLTARIYSDRYCAVKCTGGSAAYTGQPACQAIASAFPALLISAGANVCNSQYNSEAPKDARLQKLLLILSACAAGIELTLCLVIAFRLLKRQNKHLK